MQPYIKLLALLYSEVADDVITSIHDPDVSHAAYRSN